MFARKPKRGAHIAVIRKGFGFGARRCRCRARRMFSGWTLRNRTLLIGLKHVAALCGKRVASVSMHDGRLRRRGRGFAFTHKKAAMQRCK